VLGRGVGEGARLILKTERVERSRRSRGSDFNAERMLGWPCSYGGMATHCCRRGDGGGCKTAVAVRFDCGLMGAEVVLGEGGEGGGAATGCHYVSLLTLSLTRRHGARTWLSPQFPVGNTREGGWCVYAVVERVWGRKFRILGAWARWGAGEGGVRGRSFEFERCGPSGRGKRESDSDAEPPSLVSRSSGQLPGLSDWVSWSQTWGAGWGSGGGAVVDMVVAKVQFVS